MIATLAGAPAPAAAQKKNMSRPPDQPPMSSPPSNEADGNVSSSAASDADARDDNEDDDPANDEETTHASTSTGAPENSEPSSDSAEENDSQPIDAADPREYCDQFMKPYLESSSRKLYRALAGREYEFDEVQLQDWLELEVRQPDGSLKTVEFEVYREKDGKVVGLVDTTREYRRTLVLTMLEAGPIITSYQWPARNELDTRGDCRPTASRIEYPVVPVDEIDPEPFKFWGLRVIWRIPKSFDRGDQDRDNLYQTIGEVLKAQRNAPSN